MKLDDGKMPLELIPPKALLLVAEAYQVGQRKYPPRNWERGMRWGKVYGALLRHAFAWWAGERRCPKDGQHHLAAVVFCALSLMTYEETHPDLDDRSPDWEDPRERERRDRELAELVGRGRLDGSS
jgi:hypothetical protein